MNGVILTLGLLWLAAPVAAQEPCPCPPPAPPPPPLWTGSVGLSYLATSGNSDSQTIGLTAGFARQPAPWGLEIQALANAPRIREAEATAAAAGAEARVFAVRPAFSFPAEEWIARDRAFWRPDSRTRPGG